MRRCAGHVRPDAIDKRAWQGGTDDWVSTTEAARDATRCRRAGVVWVRFHWFCRQHAPIYETHYRIVQRIRDLPPRAKVR